MAYPTAMVHVDFDAAMLARVRLAAGLADRIRSIQIGIAACDSYLPLVQGSVAIPPLLTQEKLDELRTALDRQERRFRSIAGEGSRQVEWRSALDLPVEFVVREARMPDLVVTGRERLSGDLFRFVDPGALPLKIGRRILMVPAGLDRSHAADREDTRKARRALSDSLPFLRDA